MFSEKNMTYGTSHLLIGVGVIFRGRVRKKYCCVRGGGSLHENQNIVGCVLSTQPDQQKRPRCKNAQKMQKLSNIEKIFPLVSLTRHFTKFIFLEQLTPMPQFNMQICFFFFFFVVVVVFVCVFSFFKQSS